MLNFKREYITLEKDRILYPVPFTDKGKCSVYGRKKFITESGEVQLSAHVFLISKDFWTISAGQLDFTNYPNGIWNEYISIDIIERDEYTAPSINFRSMGDITPENLQGLSNYISKHLSDLERRIVEDYLFIDEGVSENIELPNLPENHFWARKNGVIVGVNIDYIKNDYTHFVKELEKDFNNFHDLTFERLKESIKNHYHVFEQEIKDIVYPQINDQAIVKKKEIDEYTELQKRELEDFIKVNKETLKGEQGIQGIPGPQGPSGITIPIASGRFAMTVEGDNLVMYYNDGTTPPNYEINEKGELVEIFNIQ